MNYQSLFRQLFVKPRYSSFIFNPFLSLHTFDFILQESKLEKTAALLTKMDSFCSQYFKLEFPAFRTMWDLWYMACDSRVGFRGEWMSDIWNNLRKSHYHGKTTQNYTFVRGHSIPDLSIKQTWLKTNFCSFGHKEPDWTCYIIGVP